MPYFELFENIEQFDISDILCITKTHLIVFCRFDYGAKAGFFFHLAQIVK